VHSLRIGIATRISLKEKPRRVSLKDRIAHATTSLSPSRGAGRAPPIDPGWRWFPTIPLYVKGADQLVDFGDESAGDFDHYKD